MVDAPIEPLFAYPQAGPRFAPKEVFQTLADTGVPYQAAQARVRSYTKDRLIHVREKGEATRPNLYEFSDLGAALILSALQDAGVQDREVLQSASTAIYAWSPNANDRDRKYIAGASSHLPRHPVDRAIVGTTMMGETWCFYFDVWRHSQTGERILDFDMLQWGDVKIGHAEIPVEAYPVASIAIMLDQMFLPVGKRLRPSQATDA